jgi:hypothetical protein
VGSNLARVEVFMTLHSALLFFDIVCTYWSEIKVIFEMKVRFYDYPFNLYLHVTTRYVCT